MRAEYGEFRSALRFWHTQKNGITFFRREKASLTLASKEWHKCWVNVKTSNKNAIMEEATRSMELYYWVPAWRCHFSRGQLWSSLDRLSQMQWRWRNYQWAPPTPPISDAVSACQPESTPGAKVQRNKYVLAKVPLKTRVSGILSGFQTRNRQGSLKQCGLCFWPWGSKILFKKIFIEI